MSKTKLRSSESTQCGFVNGRSVNSNFSAPSIKNLDESVNIGYTDFARKHMLFMYSLCCHFVVSAGAEVNVLYEVVLLERAVKADYAQSST